MLGFIYFLCWSDLWFWRNRRILRSIVGEIEGEQHDDAKYVGKIGKKLIFLVKDTIKHHNLDLYNKSNHNLLWFTECKKETLESLSKLLRMYAKDTPEGKTPNILFMEEQTINSLKEHIIS